MARVSFLVRSHATTYRSQLAPGNILGIVFILIVTSLVQANLGLIYAGGA
ncbi:hypothetical protein [Stenomitos frigidus]|nr:hypothetical protein [Stenomitos frigidus]